MDKKLIITPKYEEKTTTITIRIAQKTNKELEKAATKSGRSRNELINLALKFALEHMEFVETTE